MGRSSFGFNELDWVKFTEAYEEYLGILDIVYKEESKIKNSDGARQNERATTSGNETTVKDDGSCRSTSIEKETNCKRDSNAGKWDIWRR